MGNMTRLLLLLWAGVTVSTAVDLQKRVIGGRPCRDTERPYHVMLVDKSNTFICGGSLIHKQWILTAAHCWQWGMKAFLGVQPGPLKAIEQIVAPPVIYGDDKNRIHDIMLLQLPKPHPDLPTVSLPDCKKKPKIDDTVQIAGHAATDYNRTTNQRTPGRSQNLHCADIEVAMCAEAGKRVDNNIPQTYQKMFCGRTPGVDICHGDSGGGVLFNNMIYGVNHGGGELVCSLPAEFMDVCEYMKWIKKTTDPSFVDKIRG